MTNERLAKLTPAERAVLQGMVDGLTCTEIASRRNVSHNTIVTLGKRAAKKLGAKNKSHAAVIYAQALMVAELEYGSWQKP